jgi:hypothetical protein
MIIWSAKIHLISISGEQALEDPLCIDGKDRVQLPFFVGIGEGSGLQEPLVFCSMAPLVFLA